MAKVWHEAAPDRQHIAGIPDGQGPASTGMLESMNPTTEAERA
jgi:hypothetical protein